MPPEKWIDVGVVDITVVTVVCLGIRAAVAPTLHLDVLEYQRQCCKVLLKQK